MEYDHNWRITFLLGVIVTGIIFGSIRVSQMTGAP